MKSILSLLFVGALSDKCERTWGQALKMFVPFLFVFLAINYQYLIPINTPVGNDFHLLASLNIAHQSAFCGKTSHITGAFTAESDLDTPINKLGFQDESQRAAYCDSANFAILNEMSLSYLYTCVFKIFPSITLNELNIIANIIKVSAIALFAFILFQLGLSPIYILIISTFAHFLTHSVDQTHRFGIYSFFISNYLFLIIISILYLYGLKKYLYKMAPLGIFVGAYAAFYCDFRTSHSIVALYVLFLLLFFIYYLLKDTFSSKLKTFLFTALSFSMIYIGFQLYTYTFIKPIHEIAKAEGGNNYTYHTISHPLVLALGIRPSDLTNREGIVWSDGAGEYLAKQIDPTVNYLSKNYDKAMFIYYLKLWFYSPGEMLEIYKDKFQNFGTLKIKYIVEALKKNDLNGQILNTISWLQSYANGGWGVWIILLTSFSLLGIFHKRFSAVGLFLSFSIVGSCFLLLCESAIIMHLFVMIYHSLVNLLFVMVLFYYLQVIVNLLSSVFLKYQKHNEVKHVC